MCSAHDTLAAFDDAIADGVDIITASVAFSMIQEFDVDPLAIGTFHAMEKGILTSHAAGNNGPSGATVSSVAPWVLTVAASSMDRRIIDKVVLGNGTTVNVSFNFLYPQNNLLSIFPILISVMYFLTGEFCELFHIKWYKFSFDTWKRCFKELHRNRSKVIIVHISF